MKQRPTGISPAYRIPANDRQTAIAMWKAVPRPDGQDARHTSALLGRSVSNGTLTLWSEYRSIT